MRFVIVALMALLGSITLIGQLYVVPVSTPVPEITNDIQSLYRSTVWIGIDKPNIKGISPTFLMTGWSLLNKDGRSYIVTAAHGVAYNKTDLIIGYWLGGGTWTIVPAKIEGAFYGHQGGDIAILSVPVVIPPLPIKGPSHFSKDDEILVGGIQHDLIGKRVTPARVTVGKIIQTNTLSHTFTINGWAWNGFSGGPVLHRPTKSVIGFISHSPKSHAHNATRTVCMDATRISALILDLGL